MEAAGSREPALGIAAPQPRARQPHLLLLNVTAGPSLTQNRPRKDSSNSLGPPGQKYKQSGLDTSQGSLPSLSHVKELPGEGPAHGPGLVSPWHPAGWGPPCSVSPRRAPTLRGSDGCRTRVVTEGRVGELGHLLAAKSGCPEAAPSSLHEPFLQTWL